MERVTNIQENGGLFQEFLFSVLKEEIWKQKKEFKWENGVSVAHKGNKVYTMEWWTLIPTKTRANVREQRR